MRLANQPCIRLQRHRHAQKNKTRIETSNNKRGTKKTSSYLNGDGVAGRLNPVQVDGLEDDLCACSHIWGPILASEIPRVLPVIFRLLQKGRCIFIR